MDGKFHACLEFLKRKFIKVQREWLQACIEWIIEENTNPPSNDELCNSVYEQWLLSDLREIAEAAFPSKSTLSRTKQKEIQGNFCVQVNIVLDIGHSAYSQLQKLKGQEIDHDDVEDESDNNEAKDFFKKSSENSKMDKSKKAWKEISCRMLFMELHDGMEMIEAIEYQPINQLTLENTVPGCKLQLIGPILYRDGMFLLKASNVKYLGGNAEQLVESNSQLQILNNIVKPTDGARTETEDKIGERHSNSSLKKNASNINFTQQQQAPNQGQHQQPKPQQLNKIKTSTKVREKPKTIQKKIKPKEEISLIPDDFIDDFDEDIMGQLDVDDDVMLIDGLKANTKTINYLEQPIRKTIDNKEFHQSKITKTRHENESHFDEFNIPESDFDDDFFVTDDLDLLKESTHSKIKDSNKKDVLIGKKDSNILDISDNDSLLDDFDLPDDNIVDEKVTTIGEMTEREYPLYGRFSVKGCFKTLVSGLDFSNGYRLFAILTDDVKCVRVLLGNEALTGLIGFPASKVKQAVSSKLQHDQKDRIKKSLNIAEKSLEMNKWNLDVEFNKKENIYEIVFMKPVYI